MKKIKHLIPLFIIVILYPVALIVLEDYAPNLIKPVFTVLFILFVIVLIYVLKHKKEPDELLNDDTAKTMTQEDIINTYGEPDDIIVVNPLRNGDPDGAVLVYNEKGLLCFNGMVINKADIKEITFHNEANVYFENDYRIEIITTSNDYPRINIAVGKELMWANDVLAQIKQIADTK
jgi:Ca2+/Na+ antiporter